MNHIVKSSPERKTYESPLREAQAEETQRRILDALVRVLARGAAELSIPAVAKEAGVSVPTVYRHFGSKKGLMRGLYDVYSQRIGTSWALGDVESVETFIEHMPEIWRRMDEMDELTRAAMSTEFAYEARRAMMPNRLRDMDVALAGSGVRGPDIEKLRVVLTVLTSSNTRRAFKDFFGFDSDEASEYAAWAIRLLIDAVKRGGKGKGTKR